MLYELENRSHGHSKFYHIWAGAFTDKETGQATSAFVGCKYGRIGTQGRTIFKDFTGKYCKGEALIYAEQKVQEKLNRGYVFSNDKELAIIGGLNEPNGRVHYSKL